MLNETNSVKKNMTIKPKITEPTKVLYLFAECGE